MSFKINFELQNIDKIIPFGENRDSMHWFALTDGLLWINVGKDIIYEYSDAAIEYWKEARRYNDYYLARFCEDISQTFNYIYESIPKYLYDNIEDFEEMINCWEDQWENDHPDPSDAIYSEFEGNIPRLLKKLQDSQPDISDADYDAAYDIFLDAHTKIKTWYNDRIFDSGHLVGGPYIGFFRYADKIKILWDGRGKLENGANIWTSPYGCYEMNYSDFISEVRHFFDDFLMKMDIQVEEALNKEWGNVFLDKPGLKEEHIRRRKFFNDHVSLLLQEDKESTEWESVKQIYNEIKHDIK